MDIKEYLQKNQKGFYRIIAEMLTVERGKQLYDAINDWHESELKLLNTAHVGTRFWSVVEKRGQVYHEVKRYKRKQDAIKLLIKLKSESLTDYQLVSILNGHYAFRLSAFYR